MLEPGQREAFSAAIERFPANASRIIAWRAKPYGALIANPDDEQYFPGQPQPQRLYDLLPGEKEIIHFTEAEGAAGHCQPMARALGAQRFFDFLADHVGLTVRK